MAVCQESRRADKWMMYTSITGTSILCRKMGTIWMSKPIFNGPSSGQDCADNNLGPVFPVETECPDKHYVDRIFAFCLISIMEIEPEVRNRFTNLAEAVRQIKNRFPLPPTSSENLQSQNDINGYGLPIASDSSDGSGQDNENADPTYELSSSSSGGSSDIPNANERNSGRWQGYLAHHKGFSIHRRDLLGCGLHGRVYSSLCDFPEWHLQAEVAIKYSNDPQELLMEYKLYCSLRDLQGTLIPRCFGYRSNHHAALLVLEKMDPQPAQCPHNTSLVHW